MSLLCNYFLQKCYKSLQFKKNVLSFRMVTNSQKANCGTLNSTQPQKLLVTDYGNPTEVVQLTTFPYPNIAQNQVVVKVLASPVNPADINTIQGVYAIKPNAPFVPGNEAVMEVVEAGTKVSSLKMGDLVIPRKGTMGTWCTHLASDEDDLIKIPSNADIVSAATIAVNPCTAYRMIHDYVNLKEGDVVIQNCANSAVGQAVIQICKSKGIQTVNIVRQRENLDELKQLLNSLGATVVITDTELRTTDELKKLPKPLLALNGVSGKPGTEMLRHLANGGTMVTYGGMSRQPLTISIGSLIFNDISLRGFWMTRWNNAETNQQERLRMLNRLFEMSASGELKPPRHELVPFGDFKKALTRAMPSGGMVGKKQILSF